MIELEKAILAAVIEYPDNILYILENCDNGFFKGVENQEIYKLIKKLYDQKQIIDWNTIIELKEKVKESYIASMFESLRGLHRLGVERYLKEKISLIKRIRTKKRLLQEIEKQAKVSDVDFDKIKEIIEEGKIIETTDEEKSFNKAYDEYLEWKQKEKTNIELGFPTFDRLIDSFNYGEVVSIFGRTVTGKTFVTLNILEHILNISEEKIGFFSMEMAKPAIVERMGQVYYKKSRWEFYDDLKSKGIDVDKFLEKYKELNLYGKVYSVAEIERIIKRDSLRIVFIDFLQLLKEDLSGSQYERTTRKIREIKECAKNQNVVIFLTVQLSRKGEGGWEPVSIDMARESGAIEELSDFIIGIWSPSLKEGANEEWRGKLCMKLLKNKRGSPYSIIVNFDEKSGKIMEIEKEITDYL